MNTQECDNFDLGSKQIISTYIAPENQKRVQASAKLVDGGRAGTLSRIEELIEFSKIMAYQKIGLAYCYGMQKEALMVEAIFKYHQLPFASVSCSVGGLPQEKINEASNLCGVSCNPIGQAEVFNREKVDFVVIMGICLGHDILLQKNLKGDFSTLVVKDRMYSHNPLDGIKSLYQSLIND